ncbi:MAG: hypothetical protein AAGK37_02325 [Pseudomonadota bacterium]
MPVIRVTVPKGVWTMNEKEQIAQSLTDGIANVAEAAGKGDLKQFVTVHILEASEGGYAIGGNVVA